MQENLRWGKSEKKNHGNAGNLRCGKPIKIFVDSPSKI